MRFDPEDKQFYFSTQMIPNEEDTEASFESFKAYQSMCLNNPGTWFKNMMKTDNDEPDALRKVAGIIMGITLVGGILGALLCLPVKKYELMAWIMCVVFFVPGIITVFTATLKGARIFTESVLCQRIQGIIAVLGAIGLALVNLMYPKDVMADFVLAVFCEFAFVVFLIMLVKTIGYARAPKSIYTGEVQATCIGYVRTYEATNDDGASSSYSPFNSPVFEYYYGGSKYQAYYDVLDGGKDGKIRVGSGQVIKINPEDPSHILGNLKRQIEGPLCFALISLAATIVLLVLILR